MKEVRFEISPAIASDDLNRLFGTAWPSHRSRDFDRVLARSLTYVCAFVADRLVGFVNVAWDGGAHAFLLDPTVHPEFQRHGIGTELVHRAIEVSRQRRVEWMHVDYETRWTDFYRRCGFVPTASGLVKLTSDESG